MRRHSIDTNPYREEALMIRNRLFRLVAVASLAFHFMACQSDTKSSDSAKGESAKPGGMASIKDDMSQKNVVQIAAGSPDHTTLVTAVTAAGLADVLANPGPFTVFAPTNAAFEKLPAGTVEGLLKPDKLNDLRGVLQYHVTLSALKIESFKDGQSLWMANGGNTTFAVKDGKVTINGANIVGTVQGSNGIVHVIDAVLLPPAKP